MSANKFLCIGGHYNGQFKAEFMAGPQYVRYNKSTNWETDECISAVLVHRSKVKYRPDPAKRKAFRQAVIKKAQKKSEKKCLHCKHFVHEKDKCNERICDAAGDMDYCPC